MVSSRIDGLSWALRHISQALLVPTSKDAADSVSLLALGRAGTLARIHPNPNPDTEEVLGK